MPRVGEFADLALDAIGQQNWSALACPSSVSPTIVAQPHLLLRPRHLRVQSAACRQRGEEQPSLAPPST
jgi:hypothetical protein